MLPKTDIEKYGGKAAILSHIRDNTDLPVPPYEVKEAGQRLEPILPAFNRMAKPVIVRSSSPHEYDGFEGIFDSVPDVNDQNDLEQAVKQVEASATNERARAYAEQHGIPIDEKMHVIIQEQSPSHFCGGMLRHPNNPDLVFLTMFSGRGRYSQHYRSFLFDERDPKEPRENRGFTSSTCSSFEKFDPEDAGFLVDSYKKVEALRQITEDRALFVEFGWHPFVVYQARPFKKRETADFGLPETGRNSEKALRTDFCFGITPPEGLVFPALKSLGETESKSIIVDFLHRSDRESVVLNGTDRRLRMHLGDLAYVPSEERERYRAEIMKNWHLEHDMYSESPYCLVIPSAHRENYDVDLSVPKMGALLLGETDNFLVHGLMRLVKQASVSMGLSSGLTFTDFYEGITSGDNVRIISNGKEAVAIRE